MQNNPLYWTILLFLFTMLLLYIIKPKFIYDQEQKEFKQFGTEKGKTVLPIYIIGIFLALFMYSIVHFINCRIKNQPKNETINEINSGHNFQQQYTQQIQSLQTQLQQLLQHQIMNNLMLNQLDKCKAGSIILPNCMNI